MGKDLAGKEIGKGLDQRPNGKYRCRVKYKNQSYERIFDTLQEAKRGIIDLQYDLNHNNIYCGSDMLFDTWFTYWINNIKSGITTRTKENYISIYNTHIKDKLGDIPLGEIKPLYCQEIFTDLHNKKYSKRSMTLVKTILKAIFEDAVNNEMCDRNPMAKKITLLGIEKEPRPILKIDEQRVFEEAVKANFYGNLFRLCLKTGLRYGEIAGLKWEDIDFSHKILSVRRSVYYNHKEKCFVEKKPKTINGIRKIPLTKEAIAILNSQKALKRETQVGFQDYVFPSKYGIIIPAATLDRALVTWSKKIGLERPISMHCLRHTFATRCIEAGMKPKTLQKILGHSSLNMTMDLYVHVTEEEKIIEMKKLEKTGWDESGLAI